MTHPSWPSSAKRLSERRLVSRIVVFSAHREAKERGVHGHVVGFIFAGLPLFIYLGEQQGAQPN